MNKIKSILIMSILLVSIFMILNPVSAATYNVYPGDDIEAIIESANAGDTIYVHAGTYYPDDTITVNADNISIIGDSPFNTIIDAISSGGDCFYSLKKYIIIKNITVSNAPGYGILIDQQNVDGNWVGGEYATIENCITYCNGHTYESNGILVADYATVKNCLSYDNGCDGIGDNGHSTFINCTSFGNVYDGFYSDDGGTKVINCIAVGNGDNGFDIENNISSEVIYCNAWDNTEGDYDETPAGTGSISVDPKFVDGIDTFYLSPSSPCVDKGSTSSVALGLYNGFTTRTDGIWDKRIVDMGFHYASSNGPPPVGLPIHSILKILKGSQE